MYFFVRKRNYKCFKLENEGDVGGRDALWEKVAFTLDRGYNVFNRNLLILTSTYVK